nr:hypothetical protein OG461_07480 [Streptomyces sp. NBC_00995]
MTLLSASDPTARSCDITLEPQRRLRISVRETGAVLVNVMARTRQDGGQRHTVAVTVDGGNGGRMPLSLLSDGLHPHERGHHRIVLKMIKDLRIIDSGSRVCSLRIP